MTLPPCDGSAARRRGTRHPALLAVGTVRDHLARELVPEHHRIGLAHEAAVAHVRHQVGRGIAMNPGADLSPDPARVTRSSTAATGDRRRRILHRQFTLMTHHCAHSTPSVAESALDTNELPVWW